MLLGVEGRNVYLNGTTAWTSEDPTAGLRNFFSKAKLLFGTVQFEYINIERRHFSPFFYPESFRIINTTIGRVDNVWEIIAFPSTLSVDVPAVLYVFLSTQPRHSLWKRKNLRLETGLLAQKK